MDTKLKFCFSLAAFDLSTVHYIPVYKVKSTEITKRESQLREGGDYSTRIMPEPVKKENSSNEREQLLDLHMGAEKLYLG